MTNEISAWLYDVPEISFGNGEVSAWLGGGFGSGAGAGDWFGGAPFINIGDVTGGGGPGIGIGSRIVSPRRERVRSMDFSTTFWHSRQVSPKISIGRSPM